MRIRSLIISSFMLTALIPLAHAATPAKTSPTPATAPAAQTDDILHIENFLDGVPPEDLLKKSDPNASLRTKLFTAWLHAHRTGKQIELIGNWQSTGTASKGEFTANLSGQAVSFDWFALCTLPDSDTEKALSINHDQRITLTGTVGDSSYSIGTYGPELHLRILHASITDLTPAPSTTGPIAIRSAATLARLTDANLIDPEKQKVEIAKMADAANLADTNESNYMLKNNFTPDPGTPEQSLKHGIPYSGMPANLLFLTGKIMQVRSDTKSNGIDQKEILFATYGYSDDAFIITLHGDTISSAKKVPIPDAKFYATPQDSPVPPKPTPKPPTPPKK